MLISIDDKSFQSSLIDDVNYQNLLKSSQLPLKKKEIARFYFPCGIPQKNDFSIEQSICAAFDIIGGNGLKINELGPVVKACGFPIYWKSAFFNAASSEGIATVTKDDVVQMWKRISSCCHDDASRFVTMLAKKGNSHLEFDDFTSLMRDVIETHPGLSFLQHSKEFHSRYMNTVIARIFYSVNRSWSGKISIPEMRKSNFLEALVQLEKNDDINEETNFFSYEHFYVIYCKFWELDHDHDLIIDKVNLSRHERGVVSSRIVERIFSGATLRWKSAMFQHKMSYVDYVWFILSEEDKKTPTSIEYWFRCMDIDGDGRISMYEMEYFYEEQMRRLKFLGITPISFVDCLCQMLDLVKPSNRDYITLRDLKRCRMAHVFFNTFINVEKYLMHEKREAFARLLKEANGRTTTPGDWEVYAAAEYESLVDDEDEDDDYDL